MNTTIDLNVDRNSNIALSRQIFIKISSLILKGILKAGQRLPSSRSLAEQLKVSRNVIVDALDQLAAEGFLESRKGSGTFIADGISIHLEDKPELVEFEKIGFEDVRTDITDFRSGLPDMNFFPRHIWIQLTREIYSNQAFDPLSYHQPEGALSLRKEIASYICSRRGGKCSEQQIVITSGTTQAISLVSRLLLTAKRHLVWLEDPITYDIQRIIKNNGGTIKGVEVEENGIAVPRSTVSGSFLYATPSHQFPTGVSMNVQKRTSLLEFAADNNIYIVEDDYDSEFRFDGPPMSCMQGLDPDKIIYIGTFSKTLCPAFRIGYLILPYNLVNRGRQQKWFTDLHSPIPNQLVLAEFIRRGHYTRHLTKMRKIYKTRRLHLETMLKQEFGQSVEILGSQTGIHLCARFKGRTFNSELLFKIEQTGCKVYPVERHTLNTKKYNDTIILGYGCLDTSEIEYGVHALGKVLL
jgi:GntR family transcriptional regulator / MocR family aminotransferase